MFVFQVVCMQIAAKRYLEELKAMTVDKEFADKIVAGNGWSEPPEDPQNPEPDNLPVVKIVEYDNLWGGKGYGCTFEDDDPQKYLTAPACRNPRVYWERSKA